jgi:hypothetical protein
MTQQTKKIELHIRFQCSKCNGMVMVGAYPTTIDLEDEDQMQLYCELLNSGNIPVVVPKDMPFSWCSGEHISEDA